jgi:glutathione S-transferase
LNYIHEPYWSLRGEMLKPQAERSSAALEQNRARLRELLQYLETSLGDKEYFLGALTLTDIDVLPRFLRMESYGALPAPELPRLGAWLQRMKERPSVKAIL